MNKENISLFLAVVAIVIALGGYMYPHASIVAGDISGTTNFSNLALDGTLSVTGATTLTGATAVTGDGTINGGTFTVTSTNTATSTVTAGCYQFYATSTATPQKFQASTTPGLMASQYGACPNL